VFHGWLPTVLNLFEERETRTLLWKNLLVHRLVVDTIFRFLCYPFFSFVTLIPHTFVFGSKVLFPSLLPIRLNHSSSALLVIVELPLSVLSDQIHYNLHHLIAFERLLIQPQHEALGFGPDNPGRRAG